MKAFLLSVLCALSIASSPPPKKAAANRALLGDRLVNEKTFTDQVNASCGSGATNCVLGRLTTNYYQLFSHSQKWAMPLDDMAHSLSLRTYRKQNITEEHIQTYAVLMANKLAVDSVLCYEYYNNADALSCYEQLYYIDIGQRKIRTVMLTYDEESATADSAQVYTIDLKTEHFRQETDHDNKHKKTDNR